MMFLPTDESWVGLWQNRRRKCRRARRRTGSIWAHDFRSAGRTLCGLRRVRLLRRMVVILGNRVTPLSVAFTPTRRFASNGLDHCDDVRNGRSRVVQLQNQIKDLRVPRVWKLARLRAQCKHETRYIAMMPADQQQLACES